MGADRGQQATRSEATGNSCYGSGKAICGARVWYEPIYVPEEFDDSCLNDYERANLELLLELGA
ncbi:MAG: YARHG domain-containing protein [Hungatella sp.]|nr:YARHG domain-containing protein [Hungatella sp.]